MIQLYILSLFILQPPSNSNRLSISGGIGIGVITGSGSGKGGWSGKGHLHATITYGSAEQRELVVANLDAIPETINATLAEPGCIMYHKTRHPTDVTKMLSFEVWASESDLRTHISSNPNYAIVAPILQNGLVGFESKLYRVTESGDLKWSPDYSYLLPVSEGGSWWDDA